ncbi:FMN-linked oxidoreductase [Violaceomyces palustris]|uniref:FMN-linked oxidoreductase n=1 Tax=Violaceomyces palustris TaxID=1673888 RepID=A0ACD0NYF1_9BASI|nr:FMN-linked oxidoreductase [Violaceomyces palustris]
MTIALTPSLQHQDLSGASRIGQGGQQVRTGHCKSVSEEVEVWEADLEQAERDGEEEEAISLPPHQLLDAFPGLNVCAPMVRYSKLAFRALVARYDTHITTTPMILAREFSRNQTARDSDFTTNEVERGTYRLVPHQFQTEKERRLAEGLLQGSEGSEERQWSEKAPPQCGDDPAHGEHPDDGTDAEREKAATSRRLERKRVKVRGALVCQFASKDGITLADAAELVANSVDAVDLNCGCPQTWAYTEEIGSYLLRKPEIVRDMVRSVKARLGESYCVSVKIRVDSDLRLTDQLVRTALHAGASLLTIHGRTRHQASSHPVNLDAIKFAVDAANACGLRTAWGSSGGGASAFADGGSGGYVPCVANGDVWSLDEAIEWRSRTGTRGAMSARGLLANPALFAGYEKTPPEAVALFTQLATSWGMVSALSHRHLAYMLESSFTRRSDQIYFNSLGSMASITDYLEEEGYMRGVGGHVKVNQDGFGEVLRGLRITSRW